MKKLTNEDFIRKAKEVHGNKYDYSKTSYVDSHTKVIITCPKHGDFEVLPYNHLSGTGCKKCIRKEWTTETFIEAARKIHGDKYDYSKVEYRGTRTPVCIISHEKDKDGNEIGEIWQFPKSHLASKGCHKEHHGFKKEDAWEKRT